MGGDEREKENHMLSITTRVSGLALMIALVLALVAATPSRTAVVSAQVPECLTGTWTLADNSAFAGNLNSIFSSVGAGLTVAEVTGDVAMIIAPDGSYELRYNQFSVGLGGGFIAGAMVFDGSARGLFRETEPGMLAGSITEANIAVTMSILGMTTSIPIDFPLGEGEPQAYTCDAGSMNVTISIPGAAKIQVAFNRVG
jgi:hypothetical protein